MNAETNLRGSCLIVCEPGEMDLAESLGTELAPRHSATKIVRYSDALHAALQRDGSPSSLIALLPRTPTPGGDEPARLARMVGRLHSIAGLASSDGTVVFVQFGGGRFGTEPEPVEPELCCTAAFARSLHLERPRLCVRVVDLPAALP